MARPRTKKSGLPSWCYRDKRGKLYMLHPAGLSAGKMKYRRVTYPDLETLLAAWRVTHGDDARAGGDTVGKWLDALTVHVLQRAKHGDLAQSTATDYQRRIGNLRPVWADVRIEDVDVPMLYRWREARGEQGRVQCNRERTCLFEAFKLAVREGMLKANPVEHLEPFREKPRARYVTDADFNAVYRHATPIVRAAMLLAAVTGLRQGDLLRIRRSDFGDDGLTVRTSKTGSGLVIGWSEGLRRAVVEAVGVRDFVPLVLLSTESGKAYTGDGFRTLWHRAMTAALEATPGLVRFTFNDLRAKAGTDGRDWQLLGHLDRKTFERVYNRLPRKVAPAR